MKPTKPTGTARLQCREPNEDWHTLNARSYASREGHVDVKRQMRDFANRWSMQDCMSGHEFRVVDGDAQ